MARKEELLLSGNNADAIFQSIDMLKAMVNALRGAIAGDGVVHAQAGVLELVDYLKSCADETAGNRSIGQSGFASAAESSTV